MRISKLRIENYRNLDGVAISFDEDVTYIVGEMSPRPFRHHLYCESAPPPTRPNIAVRHRH